VGDAWFNPHLTLLGSKLYERPARSTRPGKRSNSGQDEVAREQHLIVEHALAPLDDTLGVTDPERLAQLKRDLAAVVSADAFFTLTDVAGIQSDEAIASLVRTAMTVTRVAVGTP
jgi:hypothetical protein